MPGKWRWPREGRRMAQSVALKREYAEDRARSLDAWPFANSGEYVSGRASGCREVLITQFWNYGSESDGNCR